MAESCHESSVSLVRMSIEIKNVSSLMGFSAINWEDYSWRKKKYKMDGLVFILIITLLIVGGTILSLRLHAQGRIWRTSQHVHPAFANTPLPDYEMSHYARKMLIITAVLLGVLIGVVISLINAFVH